MREKSQTRQMGAAKAVKNIRRATHKQYSADEKIRQGKVATSSEVAAQAPFQVTLNEGFQIPNCLNRKSRW